MEQKNTVLFDERPRLSGIPIILAKLPKTKSFLETLPPGCEGPTTADKGSLPLDQPGAEGDMLHNSARYRLVPESDTRGCRVGRCWWWEDRRGRDKVPGYFVKALCYYFLMIQRDNSSTVWIISTFRFS
jgi:hypothetical protein